ncbi:MAG: VOC family protein [Vicinamibacteria bacterium]|nr:VOC family protein [Vicinamibacteria bacterium]
MRIEHIAFTVKDPTSVARWWERNLGMSIVRSSDRPPFAHFVADASGRMLFELHCPAGVAVPDYRSLDARILHVAFMADDLATARDRLVEAGASLESDVEQIASGDQIVMLRDPWGLAVQLVRRGTPML